jgi:isoamylase
MDTYRKPVEFHDPTVQRTYVSHPYPLGPTTTPEGTNFSVFSANATGMEIVLFDHADAPHPSRVIPFDPTLQRTSHYWHIFVPGIKQGQLYGYRADGPDDPSAGHRFDRNKVLTDPYAKSIYVGQNYNRSAACKPGDNAATSMKSVVTDLSASIGRGIGHSTVHFAAPLSTRCTWQALPATRTPMLLPTNEAHISAWSKRFPISRH